MLLLVNIMNKDLQKDEGLAGCQKRSRLAAMNKECLRNLNYNPRDTLISNLSCLGKN
jgi:hypothetical protein